MFSTVGSSLSSSNFICITSLLNSVSTSSTTNMFLVKVTGVEELKVSALYAINLLGIVGIDKSAPLFILLFISSFKSSLMNNTVFCFIPPEEPNKTTYLLPFNINPSFVYLL